MLAQSTTTVRELSQVIGKLVASVRAIAPGPLHYRQLQMQKTRGLCKNGQSYEAVVELNRECQEELNWWLEEIQLWNGRSLIKPCPDLTLDLTSNASKLGWGATE